MDHDPPPEAGSVLAIALASLPSSRPPLQSSRNALHASRTAVLPRAQPHKRPFQHDLFEHANRIRPIRHQIVFGSGMSLGLSESEAKRFEQLDGSCAWKISFGEYAQLQRLGPTVPANAIIVYFIDRFSQALNGCGGHLPNRPACIVARAGTQWCAAHEVGHVLLTSNFSPVHINDASNLMHPVDIARSATPGLTQAQVTRIKSSPLCTPI